MAKKDKPADKPAEDFQEKPPENPAAVEKPEERPVEPGPDAALLEELVRLRAENLALVEKIAANTAPVVFPTADPERKLLASAPQKYTVTVRHSTAALKKFECLARSDDEAWDKYLDALRVKMGASEKSKKELESFLNDQNQCLRTIAKAA